MRLSLISRIASYPASPRIQPRIQPCIQSCIQDRFIPKFPNGPFRMDESSHGLQTIVFKMIHIIVSIYIYIHIIAIYIHKYMCTHSSFTCFKRKTNTKLNPILHNILFYGFLQLHTKCSFFQQKKYHRVSNFPND